MENLRRSFDTGSFPDFAWSGYAGINGSSFDQRPKTQDRYTLEFTDNLTWIKGRHVVKFGGKMRHYQWLGTDSKNYMGNWTFNGQNTENPAIRDAHRRFVRRLGAGPACQRRTRLSVRHLRRRIHGLARVRAGRFQGDRRG